MGCAASRPGATLSGLEAVPLPPRRSGRLASAELTRAAEALSRPGAADASRAAAAAAEAAAAELFASTAGARVRDRYVRATLSSYGANCKVFTAACKATGEAVAIKTIRKAAERGEQQRQRVMREVGATRLLQGHPHAVRLLDVFEDAKAYHLVMENLAGGELFDHIGAAGALTEAEAASILRSLCLFLAHAHAQGVAHMDIKPENIMFDSGGSGGVLKVIDLGSAEFLEPDQMVARAFGTVRYSSPEMAREICGQRSDVWSTGVVMYQILAGRVPFLKDTDEATLTLLQRGPQVKFNGARWRRISDAAKDCIRLMLHPDPKKRPTASQVLAHPWLAAEAPRTAIDAPILHQLQLFASLNRARRLMLGVAAKSLSGAEASQLLRRFLALDKDFNGTLDLKELSEAARQVAPQLTESDLAAMFAALDVDRTGSVDAQEFFAAVLSCAAPSPEAADSLMERSFRTLDRAANGFITKQDLVKALSLQRPAALEEGGIEKELAQEFAAMDANGDGVVTLDEFKSAMRTMSLDRSSVSSLNLDRSDSGLWGGGSVTGGSGSVAGSSPKATAGGSVSSLLLGRPGSGSAGAGAGGGGVSGGGASASGGTGPLPVVTEGAAFGGGSSPGRVAPRAPGGGAAAAAAAAAARGHQASPLGAPERMVGGSGGGGGGGGGGGVASSSSCGGGPAAAQQGDPGKGRLGLSRKKAAREASSSRAAINKQQQQQQQQGPDLTSPFAAAAWDAS